MAADSQTTVGDYGKYYGAQKLTRINGMVVGCAGIVGDIEKWSKAYSRQ